MNCSEFETLLDEQFGAFRLTESQELADHAAQCADCRGRRDRYRLLAESIVVWRDQTPDVNLIESVIAAQQIATDCCDSSENPDLASVSRALIADHSARQFAAVTHNAALQRRYSSMRLAATASLVALVCVTIAVWLLHNKPSSEPSLATNRDAEVPVVTKAAPLAEARPADRPGSSRRPDGAGPEQSDSDLAPELAPYSSLVQMATTALSEATVLILPGTAGSQMPLRGTPPSDEAGSTEADGWIDDLQHQLRPVGRSLGNAFDFLWQAGQSVDG